MCAVSSWASEKTLLTVVKHAEHESHRRNRCYVPSAHVLRAFQNFVIWPDWTFPLLSKSPSPPPQPLASVVLLPVAMASHALGARGGLDVQGLPFCDWPISPA